MNRVSPAQVAVVLVSLCTGLSETYTTEAVSIALPDVFSLDISLPASHFHGNDGSPELKALDVHLHIFPHPPVTHREELDSETSSATARSLLQTNVNFPGGNVSVGGPPAPSPSVAVNFPGGDVKVGDGGVHVSFPGGQVNIGGRRLASAEGEIRATGRILLQTNVNFPGGNASVGTPGPAPAAVDVNFPGGSVNLGGDNPKIVFPGGSVNLGRKLLSGNQAPANASINTNNAPPAGSSGELVPLGEDLPTAADISIVLPPFPQYEDGHIPPVNLTAVAILASQILQALPHILTDAVYPQMSRMQAEREQGGSVWNSPYNFSVGGKFAVAPTASSRRLIEVS